MVERAIAGDFDGFGELYMFYLDKIYRYIFLRTGNSQDAEDLTEQVFINAWEGLSTFKLRENRIINWLYKIAHNVVVDSYRRNAKRTEVSLEEESGWDEPPAFTLDEVIKSEEASALAAAIRQLSDEQQQVIILRFVEGMRHAEVATILGKSEGACRVIQYQALTNLQKLMAKVREGNS